MTYIDQEDLKEAYFQVPVVRAEDIENARCVLETFAEYLVTDWQRLSEITKEQRRQVRALQLSRQEFAHLVLERGGTDPAALREVTRRLGLTRLPDRVLVVKPEAEEDYETPATPFDVGFTAALQAVDEECEKHENVVAAHLRKQGITVFFNDHEGRNPSAGDYYAHRLARSILHAVEQRCGMRARAGIGTAKEDWRQLADSCHEASMALAASNETIAPYRKPVASFEDLSVASEAICRAIAERKIETARLAAASLPLLVNRRLGDRIEHLPAQRQFLAGALDSACFASQRLGAEVEAIARVRGEAGEELSGAASLFDLQQAWLRGIEQVLDEIRRIYSGKRRKIVERACRMIDRNLEHLPVALPVSLPAIASAFGISPGHLSRTIKQVTGVTFERYVMTRRVELAKRLLLEPLNNASQVAERCGFSDPSYLARVFRKIAGCAPSEYARDPWRASPSAG